MIMLKEGIETKVWLLPYEKSSIDENTLVQTSGEALTITSVKNYEDLLVKVILPDGESVIVKADQLITAVKKCVL